MASHVATLPVPTERLRPAQSGLGVCGHDTEAEHDKIMIGVDTTLVDSQPPVCHLVTGQAIIQEDQHWCDPCGKAAAGRASCTSSRARMVVWYNLT
jgi:hypothetical protein